MYQNTKGPWKPSQTAPKAITDEQELAYAHSCKLIQLAHNYMYMYVQCIYVVCTL